jgi:hypothetical protein
VPTLCRRNRKDSLINSVGIHAEDFSYQEISSGVIHGSRVPKDGAGFHEPGMRLLSLKAAKKDSMKNSGVNKRAEERPNI